MTKVLVPPLKTQGIKTKLVPLISQLAVLEKDEVWVEPFMGSGVVGFNIAPERAVFADGNPHVIAFYRAVQEGRITVGTARDFLEEEGAKLALRDVEHYLEVRARFNAHHDPLDFLFLNRSCFNGMIRFSRKGQFNVPYGHKPHRFAKAYVTKICNQINQVARLMAGHDWVFKHQSFEVTIAEAPERSFIYCDPPYTGRHTDYYDSWSEAQEIALKECLSRHPSRFMISTWDHNAYHRNEVIDEVWSSCFKTTALHFYHLGARESNRRPIVEALLTNYPPPLSNPGV